MSLQKPLCALLIFLLEERDLRNDNSTFTKRIFSFSVKTRYPYWSTAIDSKMNKVAEQKPLIYVGVFEMC